MSAAASSYLGRDLLLALIRLYRRRISGRGPLSRVRCTFEGTESCSRYAQRVTATVATGLLGALCLIIGRLRRCRQASLQREGAALTWGPLFDAFATGASGAVHRLDRALTAAGERASTRAAVLRSALIVARYCGQSVVVRGGLALLGRYQRQLDAPAGHVLIRDGRHVHQWLRRRFVRRLVLWVVAASLIGSVALATWTEAALLLAALLFVALALTSALQYRRQRQRHAAQVLVNRFTWPEVGCQHDNQARSLQSTHHNAIPSPHK